MLRTLVIAVVSMMATIANAQSGYSIEGKLTGEHDGEKVMLFYSDAGTMLKDSTIVKNGSFLLKGKVSEVVNAKITLRAPSEPIGDEQEFFLENVSYKLNGMSIKDAQIIGGKVQADFMALSSGLKPLQARMKPVTEKLTQYYKEKNEKARAELLPELQAIRKEMNAVEDAFMQQYPKSYVSLHLIYYRSRAGIDVDKVGPIFNALNPDVKATSLGKKLGDRLEVAMKTAIGRPALNFVQNNTDGKPVSLKSLKGKYVLLDFWASWCGPCRAENPNVVKAYNKFKDKNFEIIAVSLDDKKEPWLKAIEKDGLPWIHVSDLKGWKNEVAVMYGVNAVPQNFIIGPDGIILAKNLRGDELEKKLQEFIKE